MRSPWEPSVQQIREIHFLATETIPADALALRAACFPGPGDPEGGEDDFDRRSVHLILRETSRVAAYGRLTIGAPGVFRTWSNGAAQLPEGSDVADLGRCFVHPDYRGLGLLKLVCLEGLRLASKLSMRVVNGAYIPGHFVAGCVHDIGFRDSGNPVEQHEPNGLKVTIQLVTCELGMSADKILSEYGLLIHRIEKRGFMLSNNAEAIVKFPVLKI